MNFKANVTAKYIVQSGDVVHIHHKQFTDIDHAFMAYVLAGGGSVSTVVSLLKKAAVKSQDYLDSLMTQFNVKDLKGLAGEIIEYWQNHPQDVERFMKKSA
jgi:hypothetical protein